jgi:sRNA-binding carbon storage regulator CsrA
MNEPKKRKTACISRYPGQKIQINDSITVMISRIDGNRVYVYVEGPEDISVTRPTKESDLADREAGKSKKDPA